MALNHLNQAGTRSSNRAIVSLQRPRHGSFKLWRYDNGWFLRSPHSGCPSSERTNQTDDPRPRATSENDVHAESFPWNFMAQKSSHQKMIKSIISKANHPMSHLHQKILANSCPNPGTGLESHRKDLRTENLGERLIKATATVPIAW